MQENGSEIRRLALGILLQAYRDMLTSRKRATAKQRLWRQDALDWFFSDESEPGSLQWVCRILQTDPEGIRRWVRTPLSPRLFLLGLSSEQRQNGLL